MFAPPAKGRLVVASPSLEDPNFRRTVVFLLAADDDGALGVVLNRPSGTAVKEVVPQWGFHTNPAPQSVRRPRKGGARGCHPQINRRT